MACDIRLILIAFLLTITAFITIRRCACTTLKGSCKTPFFYAEYSPISDTYKSVLIRDLPVPVTVARVLVLKQAAALTRRRAKHTRLN